MLRPPSTRRRVPPTLGLALAPLLVACDASVASGLDEVQANAVVEALGRAGIDARKARAAGAGDAAHEVRVASGELTSALAVLREEALPREDPPGLGDVFREPALVPTPTEERARLAAALAGDLEGTLRSLPTVRDARVHVALAASEARRLDPSATPPRPEASVLLTVAAGAAAPGDADVRRLVAGAVQGMRPDDVAVVRVEAPPGPAAEAARPRPLTAVGPFRVAAESAPGLRALLAGLLSVLAILAGALPWLVRRQAARLRRLRAALAAAEAAPGAAPPPQESS